MMGIGLTGRPSGGSRFSRGWCGDIQDHAGTRPFARGLARKRHVVDLESGFSGGMYYNVLLANPVTFVRV